MVWYSHVLKNFPQFVVIHTIKGFGIVNKAEVDVFLELSCFFDDPVDVGNLISFSLWELECKSRKSRDTWSNRQSQPWSTKLSRAKANRLLPRECTSHSKHPLPTKREDTWTSPDGQYQNQTDFTFCSQRWRSSIQSAKTRLGVDWCSDHELLIAKFRLKESEENH